MCEYDCKEECYLLSTLTGQTPSLRNPQYQNENWLRSYFDLLTKIQSQNCGNPILMARLIFA
jgi:hypothetical protein